MKYVFALGRNSRGPMGRWFLLCSKNVGKWHLKKYANCDSQPRADLGLSDMDSGHVDGSISGPDPGPTSKNNIRLAANIISNNKYKSCNNNLYFIALLGYSRKSPKIYKIPYISPHSYPPYGGVWYRSAIRVDSPRMMQDRCTSAVVIHGNH